MFRKIFYLFMFILEVCVKKFRVCGSGREMILVLEMVLRYWFWYFFILYFIWVFEYFCLILGMDGESWKRLDMGFRFFLLDCVFKFGLV